MDKSDIANYTGIWCPVMQDYCRKKDFPEELSISLGAEDISEVPRRAKRLRKLAHILPHTLGSNDIAALLGYAPDQDPINLPANLIYLDFAIEEAFDKDKVTVIPACNPQPDQPIEYKMIVVDESILPETVRSDGRYSGKDLRWRHLDGRQLVFTNAERPGKRHLYLHNVLSLLRSQTVEPP